MKRCVCVSLHVSRGLSLAGLRMVHNPIEGAWEVAVLEVCS